MVGDTDQAQEFQADPFLVNCEFEPGIAYTLLGIGEGWTATGLTPFSQTVYPNICTGWFWKFWQLLEVSLEVHDRRSTGQPNLRLILYLDALQAPFGGGAPTWAKSWEKSNTSTVYNSLVIDVFYHSCQANSWSYPLRVSCPTSPQIRHCYEHVVCPSWIRILWLRRWGDLFMRFFSTAAQWATSGLRHLDNHISCIRGRRDTLPCVLWKLGLCFQTFPHIWFSLFVSYFSAISIAMHFHRTFEVIRFNPRIQKFCICMLHVLC